jgi:hypothetical protein
MATLSIQLPDELRDVLAKRASERGHSTVESYVEELVRNEAGMRDEYYGAPADLCPRNRNEFEALVQRSLDSPLREIGPEDWDALRRDLIAKYGKQKAG